MAIQEAVRPSDTTTAGGGLAEALRGNVRQYGMVAALAIIVVIFQVWSGILLNPQNVTNLLAQNGYILILAIGMVVVIIAGHIDLSVGSIAGFIGALAADLTISHHWPWQLTVVFCCALGALIGAWQGFWVAYVGIPSFIVTLAGMLVFRGATQKLLDGSTIAGFPQGFQDISKGFLPDLGKNQVYHWPTIILAVLAVVAVVGLELRQRRAQVRYGFGTTPLWMFAAKTLLISAAILTFAFILASYKGIPIIGLITIAMLVVYAFVMRVSVIGRHVYAIGGNASAAKLSGVKNQRVTFLVFVNMGLLAAFAGIVFAARLNAGTPQAGVNMELEAIAAAFVGGASSSGGVGTVLGAVIGGLVLGVLNNGMSLVSIGTDIQQIVKGLVLLAAVGFDIYNRRKSGT
ncbi:putative multiple sugar transport system permease protein [Motilibacter rhizosphaerae]|uniref:Xylose transport system permease protein XylH n=1 Tax=Motilibacter rhizosphaerae TaxID=598652 RepID=A0A4Q7NWE5_9ACTN|nr:multiple monosaccharide ABC transporter permease [Motilibacter rhizosphaerae]RZS91535.1 putative multiple sugar transport system permease protein [Motilibacter rhizosphaerae]